MRRVVPALAALALIAGCGGGGDSASTRITSDTLTIYTGLPLRGARAEEGRAVLRGEKLALHDAGGHVANLEIGLIALDDTDASGGWSPGVVAANARQAAQNPTTIAYIGELDSGATAVSVPITNEIGVLQVSPLSEYSGLTQPSDKGEPDKYYPSGQRTFARLVPTGTDEARALASWIHAQGVQTVSMAYDGLQEGLGQGAELERAMHAQGIQVTDVVRVDPHADGIDDVRGDAVDLARAGTQAVVFAGATTRSALALMRAVHDRDPGDKLFATSGVATPAFAAGLQNAERQVYLTSPLLPAGRLAPAAKAVAARYRSLFGEAPPPAAFYGYEAMRGVLDAIRRAGRRDNDRRAVIASYFQTNAPDSVLGPYAIDGAGDTTAATFGGFRVENGRLRFERRLAVAPG